ncbi:hypothetical protein D5R40_12615 [Okeania hirsuta]|uniref:Uncharacterized protein n=1 Tax=Okeania hirsuta TaxID=1458930 RepID=A0A3N6PM47_9CYAN|nr:hypothetical protein D4Z78_26710 [Okeania hirsuta]RQH43619.1 hypothetical protein D5R40_12615 [Okeania hirsuta]
MVVHSNGKGSTGSLGRWGVWEMRSVGEIKKYVSYHYYAGLSRDLGKYRWAEAFALKRHKY